MSVFEIEGVAKRKVECDVAIIDIKFRAISKSPQEVSQKVMVECERFLREIGKAGLKTEHVRYEGDDIGIRTHQDVETYYGVRKVSIRIPFEMRRINAIHKILRRGKFDYEMSVDGDVSNMQELKTELSKEALKNSRYDAEQLAEVLGIKVKGVESIRKDRWRDEQSIGFDGVNFSDLFGDFFKDGTEKRESDYLAAKTMEVSVQLKVSWNLE